MKFALRNQCFRLAAAILLLLAATQASAVVCQFIPTSGAWNVPANWANCTGGNGVPANVPGPADRAEITGKTVQLGAGNTTVGDLYLGSALVQGTGLANTTLDVVAAGTIAWGSGSYTFQNLTVNFTSTAVIPAANGPLTIDSSVMVLNAPSVFLADAITITGTGAKITNNGFFNPSTSLTMSAGGVFENNSVFAPASPITINGTFINQGAFLTSAGAPVVLTNAAAFSQPVGSGFIGGDGTISASTQTLTIANGFIEGNTTFVLSLLNNTGGTVAPGGFGVSGSITVTGDYAQGPGGALEIEIAGGMVGPVVDRLVVSGTATLSSTTLNVFYIDTGFGPYVPSQGDSQNFVDAGVLSGTFTTFNHPVSGNIVSLNYTPQFAQFIVGPSTSLITNTNDSGPGSLRDVLFALNSCDVSGVDVLFDLGVSGGTISPLSPLPTVTCPMNFRGYSQTGSSRNTSNSDWNGVLNITLDGSLCTGGCVGLHINAPNVLVEGIRFQNWDKGVQLSSSADTALVFGNFFSGGKVGVSHEGGNASQVGSSAIIDRNVFVNTTQSGIESILHTTSPGLIVENNLIGAGAGLAPGPNPKGVYINGSNGILAQSNI
ncbi:MAG: hypothetical protein ABL931_22400, partial [Usitatibacteraceae bacterium]